MAQTLTGASLENGLSQSEDDQGHSNTARRDLRQVNYCDKNRGHVGFIPLGDFSIDHLPHLYRDEDVFQLVKATSDLTFLLRRSAASSGTNTESEFTARRTSGHGTGWVSQVVKGSFENCKCEQCHNNPKRACGEIYMKTAYHVIQNDAEANLTKCCFFFDSNELSIKELHSLSGLRVVEADNEGDWCEMMCATHDSDLVNKLHGMHKLWFTLNKKVHDKYSKCDTEPVQCTEGGSSDERNVCIIASHPHGHSKHITVGTWTQDSTTVDDDRYVQQRSYEYSTPTCPGSSGAPVITLPKDGVRILCWSNYAAHSRGPKNAPNRSGGVREAMLLPQNQSD